MPLPTITTIESPRLQLVPVAGAHLADLLEVNGDDAVTKFLPYASWASLADGEAWLSRMQAMAAAGSGQQLAVVHKTDGRAIGGLLLFKYDEGSRRAELGYVLGRQHWRQGLMQEAVAAACDHAFSALAIRRIEAEVNPANIGSCRLLLAAGFSHEGTLRQRWVAKGVTYDTNLYGLLADEWRRT